MEYTVRPYKKGEEQYVAEAHRRIYREEYNWGPAFSEYAAAIALDFAKKEHGPGVGRRGYGRRPPSRLHHALRRRGQHRPAAAVPGGA